jgi:hypothetical protein
MNVYRPRRLPPLRRVALLIRGLGALLPLWPLILITGLVLSPVGPHLRIQYTYVGDYKYRQDNIIACDYLGFGGWVHVNGYCRLFTILDRRDFVDD